MEHDYTSSTTIKNLGNITEYPLNWPSDQKCSTHELVIDANFIYVTGQNMDKVAKLDYQGKILAYFEMPEGSGPHGLLLDTEGNLWVSLEFKGTVAQLDPDGCIVKEIDVNLYAKDAKTPINVAPHGIGLDADGKHIWFTGKRTSTVGKFNIVTETVEHFQLDNLSSLPIFLSAGSNGTMWGTELFSSAILNVTPDGTVKEYTIPTSNSRPIAVIPDPSEACMWFTEETGVKIGKIDMDGTITEYPVPALQKNDILASLAFDSDHNLWVQVYVDHNNPTPEGRDYLIKFDKSIRHVTGSSISGVPFSVHIVPNTGTMMHRIKMDHDGNLWFTEMMTDTVGVIRF
jgi:virginiamycin B lyase